MSFYPSNNIVKRFEETRSEYSWEEVPADIKPSLSESVQYAIVKRRAKLQEMYKTCTALVGATLFCRFAPESIPIAPTIDNELTVYALGTIAILGIADRVGIINGENEYISREYEELRLKHLIQSED